MKQKIELKWSKRQNDWLFNAPDNAGHTMAGVFFDMTKTTGHRTDWQENLMVMLSERGYNYKTFKITCEKI